MAARVGGRLVARGGLRRGPRPRAPAGFANLAAGRLAPAALTFAALSRRFTVARPTRARLPLLAALGVTVMKANPRELLGHREQVALLEGLPTPVAP